MFKEIIFTNTLGLNFYPPQPAIKNIPDWYKNTPEYFNDGGKKMADDLNTPHTIKKCIPVFDAISAGYIVYSPVDVQVTREGGLPYYRWPSQDAIGFHPVEQAPLHPNKNKYPYPKWTNHWAIRTKPGYSVLVTQPLHRESVFTILPGIVDTDKYYAPINFPFILNDPEWEGLIPAGTPIAQIIPFKREIHKMIIGGEEENLEVQKNKLQLMTRFFNRYKTLFWTRKEYK